MSSSHAGSFGARHPKLRRFLMASIVLGAVALGAVLSLWLRPSTDPGSPGPAGPDSPSPSPQARPLAGRIEAPDDGVYWGVFRDGAPYDRRTVRDVEREVGRRPAIVMWYQEWAGGPMFDVDSARWLEERGIVPMVTWEPWKPPARFGDLDVEQRRYRLARIASGEFDPFILRYALRIREYGGPVFLRPMHEMDGFWYPWGGLVNGNSPKDFVAAWRHVHAIFHEAGATNVTWVWSVNHLSVPDTRANSIHRYWPGRRYVDWIGISGFNWGAAGIDSRWRTFDQVYEDRYADLRRYERPIVLTEIGTPEIGGDKAAWIRDTFRTMARDYPRVKAFVWYDKDDGRARDWRISSTEASLDAFRAIVRRDRILSAPAALDNAPTPAPTP